MDGVKPHMDLPETEVPPEDRQNSIFVDFSHNEFFCVCVFPCISCPASVSRFLEPHTPLCGAVLLLQNGKRLLCPFVVEAFILEHRTVIFPSQRLIQSNALSLGSPVFPYPALSRFPFLAKEENDLNLLLHWLALGKRTVLEKQKASWFCALIGRRPVFTVQTWQLFCLGPFEDETSLPLVRSLPAGLELCGNLFFFPNVLAQRCSLYFWGSATWQPCVCLRVYFYLPWLELGANCSKEHVFLQIQKFRSDALMKYLFPGIPFLLFLWNFENRYIS